MIDFNSAYGAGSYPKDLKPMIEDHIKICEREFFEDFPQFKDDPKFWESEEWQGHEESYYSDLHIYYFVRVTVNEYHDPEILKIESGYSVSCGIHIKETLTTEKEILINKIDWDRTESLDLVNIEQVIIDAYLSISN